jgi:hypothetical protein
VKIIGQAFDWNFEDPPAEVIEVIIQKIPADKTISDLGFEAVKSHVGQRLGGDDKKALHNVSSKNS